MVQGTFWKKQFFCDGDQAHSADEFLKGVLIAAPLTLGLSIPESKDMSESGVGGIVFSSSWACQRAQYGLIKEYTLNHIQGGLIKEDTLSHIWDNTCDSRSIP